MSKQGILIQFVHWKAAFCSYKVLISLLFILEVNLIKILEEPHFKLLYIKNNQSFLLLVLRVQTYSSTIFLLKQIRKLRASWYKNWVPEINHQPIISKKGTSASNNWADFVLVSWPQRAPHSTNENVPF